MLEWSPVTELDEARGLPRTTMVTRRVLAVGGGKAFHAVAGFAGGVLIARALGPTGFGLYSLCVAVTMLAQETCGYGLEAALVRSASPLWPARGAEARAQAAALLWLKAITAGGLVVVGIPLVWGIGVIAFRQPLAVFAVSMGLLGALSTALWRGSLAIFQSKGQFERHAVTQASPNVLRVAALAALAGLGALELGEALVLHVACPALVLAVVMAPSARRLTRARPRAPEAARTILHLGRWLVLSSLLFAAHYRADVLMLSALSGSAVVGIYNAGFLLASVVDYVTLSLDTVLLPGYSSAPAGSSLVSHARKTSFMLLAAVAVLIPVAVLARPVVVLCFGHAFGSAAVVLQLLIPGVTATLVTQPFLVAFYARGKVRSLVPIDGLVLAMNLTANALLIPRYGAPGAAVATSLARIVRAILIVRLGSNT